MQPAARNRYLEGRVHGASPFRLRAMLVERAFQLSRSIPVMWNEARFEEASVEAGKFRTILRELYVTVDSATSETAARVRGLYEYLYQTSTVALLRRDAAGLSQVEQLLKFECETWREVAAKFEVREDVAPVQTLSARVG